MWQKFQLILRNSKRVTMLWTAKSQFFFAAGNQTRLQIKIKLAISSQWDWKFISECKTAWMIAWLVFFRILLHISGSFSSTIDKCGGKSAKMRTLVRLTPERLELALTLIFLVENVVFFGNGNGDCFSRSRLSEI